MKFNIPTCLLALILLLAGCQKESESYKFLVQSETPAGEAGSKTCLVNESLVYWQEGDEIDAWRKNGNTQGVKLVFHGNWKDTTALFVPESEDFKFGGSGNTFMALFPHNDTNAFDGSTPTIYFSKVQPYANDNTFGATACPMVAYGGIDYGENIVRMIFHNLCGIVRIQLRNSASTNGSVTLRNIQFISANSNLPLSGSFTISNYDQYNPYVVPASGSNSVIINNFNGLEIGNDLLTFYLTLPAAQETVQGNDRYVEYRLTMLVEAECAGSPLYVKKQFTVRIRRNGITKMPALTIDAWSTTQDGTNSTSVGLAGNGTLQRPFLIYTADDLRKVRNAFNNNLTINGVTVNDETSYCYFRIMRSDIKLDNNVSNCDWNEGIRHFRGSMVYGANQTGSLGIENNTKVPIFESITDKGIVENLAVWGSCSWTEDLSGKSFSPLCIENNGRMVNCRVLDNSSYVMNTSSSSNFGIAGICVTNHGIVTGCGCRATLVAPSVAGICLENSGENAKIVACYTSSPMQVHSGSLGAAQAAGICHQNSALVKDCYFASNINAAIPTNWGGIVYQNNAGGSVTHCYVDASGIIQTTTSVGGIVHTMVDGVVDNCRNEADLMNVQQTTNGGLGSIVYSMQGGEVRNCIRYRPTGSLTCTGSGAVGGFVARMTGGTVRNGAFYGDMTQSTVQTRGAFVGDLRGGTIENVYGYQTSIGPATDFYGRMSGTTTTLNYCYGQTSQQYVSHTDALGTDLNGWTPEPGIYRKWISIPSNPPMIDQSSQGSDAFLPLSSGSKRRR
jgi:hypothetical protein